MNKLFTEEEYREAARIWREQNKDAQKITFKANIELPSGKKVPIGRRMNNMRQNSKRLTEEQKEFWKEYGLFEEKKESYTEEEYREAARIWREQNKDAQLIPQRVVIELPNGKKVPIGTRMNNMRKNPERLTEEQKEFWEEYGLFEEKKGSYSEEEYREAARIWREQNKDTQLIPKRAVIELPNGKKVPVGTRMNDMRQNQEKLTKEQKEFWEEYGLLYQKETKESTPSSLEKYTELFNGNKEKAERVVNCLKDLREKRKTKKKEDWNIDNILKEFDVDIKTLQKYLERTKIEKSPKMETLTYQGKTLRTFCIENGYNYEVIARAIKLHDFCEQDSLEQLINRAITMYNKKGQKEPATWIYEKYGNLVKHILLNLNLDAKSILLDMTNYTITLEEAIRHEVFKRNNDKKENSWLEELYNFLIEEVQENKEKNQTETDIAEMFVILVQEYHLTQEEYQLLWNLFAKYIKTIKEYQKIEVGLETNQERKLQKIKDYGLDEMDIEESFFVALDFDKGVLLGRQSELYQRRQLLRQYIIDWDYYTELEKEQIKTSNHFTEEEIKYIEKTRREINQVVSESKRK